MKMNNCNNSLENPYRLITFFKLSRSLNEDNNVDLTGKN